MAWLRIDDRVRTHPKIVQAGPSAAWFWFCSVCYCREHLTDGFIAANMLATLAPGVPKFKPLVAALIQAGLWHEAEGGYRIHDFLDWNPSREKVLQTRKEDLARKQQPRSAKDSTTDSISESTTESDRNPDGFQNISSRAHAGVRARALSGSVDQEDRFSQTAIHRRRHPDLMTLGPVELWASQFAQLVAMAAPRFGGDRDKADHAVRTWVAAVDDDLVRDGASAEAIKQPRKFWQDLAADQFGRKTSLARICSRRHEPPCADEVACTQRYIDEGRALIKARA